MVGCLLLATLLAVAIGLGVGLGVGLGLRNSGSSSTEKLVDGVRTSNLMSHLRVRESIVECIYIV